MKRGLLALAATVALAGCQRRTHERPARPPHAPLAYQGDTLPRPDEQGDPQEGGELRVAMEAEPPSLNYQLDPLDLWGKKLDELLYESLARPNPRTFVHEPRLAERWEISADKLTLTFYLRKGVRWHDGKPFTADDVLFTFDKILDPSSKTMATRSYLEPLATYDKIDAFTVRFVLKHPYRFAFDAIAEIFIYPKHVYARGDFNTHPANREPVGTGRFKLVRWLTGDEIVLARNDAYFGPKARLTRLIFKYVPDPNVRLALLRRGELDVIERASPEVWRQVADDPELTARIWRLRHVPTSLQWIGWNEARVVFRDARVRRALTMLLDRQDIVDNLRLGLDSIAVSWFYPGAPEYNAKLEPVPYDPDGAMELLDEAGFRDDDGDGVRERDKVKLAFTFLYAAGNPFYEQLAGLLQSELKKAGIAVETSRLDWAVFMERLRKHEFDACSLLWQLSPRSDPYQIWHSAQVDGGSNFISFRNAEADTIIEAARQEFDDEKRVALYQRFSEILYEQQPYTMLFNRYSLSLVSRKFGGIYSTPYGVLRYDDFYRLAPRAAAVP